MDNSSVSDVADEKEHSELEDKSSDQKEEGGEETHEVSLSSEYFESITCNWASTTPFPRGLVTVGNVDDPDQWDQSGDKRDIIHVITDENVALLKRIDDSNSLPTLHIKLRDKFVYIKHISVVCEPRSVEIYGKYGEYIESCSLELVGTVGDVSYYGTQIELLTSQEISLKFITSQPRMQLCGVKLLIKKAPESLTTSCDYNLVLHRLANSSVPLSENAARFKKCLEEFSGSRFQSKQDILDKNGQLEPTILKALQRMQSERLLNESKNPPSTIESNEAGRPERCDSHQSSSINNSAESQSTFLKTYVDERLCSLEQKIEANFKKQLEELESKQNEKLDSILFILKNSVSK